MVTKGVRTGSEHALDGRAVVTIFCVDVVPSIQVQLEFLVDHILRRYKAYASHSRALGRMLEGGGVTHP
jgi:hypothetical protein